MTVTVNTTDKVLEGKLIITDETSSSKLRLIIQSEKDGNVVVEFSKSEFDFLKREVNDR
jgi:hypothetical protein